MRDLLLLGFITMGCVGVYLIVQSVRGMSRRPLEPVPAPPVAPAEPIADDDVLTRRTTIEPILSQRPPEPSALETADDRPRLIATVACVSDLGRRRTRNEDSTLVMDDERIYVIADGMGGHAAGDVASRTAVETIASAVQSGAASATEGEPRSPGEELLRAVELANDAVYRKAHSDETLAGMGTTVVAIRLTLAQRRVDVVHVGDSRCYRRRGDSFRQLTSDHTLAELGVVGPAAGKLVRVVGTEPKVRPDLFTDTPVPDDIYLLCSDGLSRMVPEDDIVGILRREPDVTLATRRLVDVANENGGADNVSVIVVHVVASPA